MTNDNTRRHETEALIEAIWGPCESEIPVPPVDPVQRKLQNQALAVALKAYLQQYLADEGAP